MMAIMMTNVKMMTMMMDDEYCNLWRCSAGRVSTGSANGGWDTIHHPPSTISLLCPLIKMMMAMKIIITTMMILRMVITIMLMIVCNADGGGDHNNDGDEGDDDDGFYNDEVDYQTHVR